MCEYDIPYLLLDDTKKSILHQNATENLKKPSVLLKNIEPEKPSLLLKAEKHRTQKTELLHNDINCKCNLKV